MKTIISAIVDELATRSLSFLIDRYFKPVPYKEDSMRRLQRMLLRVHLTVEEAEGRCITNQAMLQQLNILTTVMYKGYYMLDTFIKLLPEEEEDKKDHGVSRFLSLSKFSPGKRVCFSAASKNGKEKLEEILENLEATITDMTEFVIFLRNYPPMFRQPYITYLFMEKCMFGRQLEMERVITFLLHEEPPHGCSFGVLPIVDPGKVGKTTLVEHVCCDERVRNHFSHIIFLSDNDFREEKQCKLRDGSRIKHQSGDLNEEKILVIIELVGDIEKSAWRRLHSASQSTIPRGSKVVITSQSENIINFGTTQALNLNFLSREEYWYFFRALVFGSTNPEEQPNLTSIAARMIFEEYFDQALYAPFTGPFLDLNNMANLMKSSVGMQNWRRILECMRENRQQNEHLSRKILCDFGMDSDHIFLPIAAKTTQYCVFRLRKQSSGLNSHEGLSATNNTTRTAASRLQASKYTATPLSNTLNKP